MRIAILLGACFIAASSNAFADGTPSEQALARKVYAEAMASVQCDTTLITAQQMINADEAIIRKLDAESDVEQDAELDDSK